MRKGTRSEQQADGPGRERVRPWTRGQRRKFSHKRACEKKSTSDLDPLADIFLPFSIKFKEKEKKKKTKRQR